VRLFRNLFLLKNAPLLVIGQLAYWLFLPLIAQGQPVPNDNLDNRLPLILGESLESRTDGCTVQWACVDEALTGQKIDYHNDQWFAFRPPNAGQFYLNVNGQKCRDVKGVQVIVFTALELCKPNTYTILSATSLGTQDDVFIPVTATAAGQEIIICIDGYLHDYCRFRINIDTAAHGLPAFTPPRVHPTPLGSTIVELKWLLPDSLPDATAFVIRRRVASAARSAEVGFQPVVRNAAGALQRAYTAIDTLPRQGQYVYQVLTEGTAVPILVHQETFLLSAAQVQRSGRKLPLPVGRFRMGVDLTVIVTDASTGRIIRRTQVARSPTQPPPALFTADFVQQGIQRIRVSITDVSAPQGSVTEEFEVDI
jgi:hypothetical protein